jgi:putative transposase
LIEIDFSMTGQKVAEALNRRLLDGAVPISPTVDHGTEFTCKALEEWAWQRGVKLDFTRPGKPTDNSHIESCNSRLRDECLNVNQFLSIEDAKEKIEAWRLDYNHHRPHGSLDHLTPSEFIQISQEHGSGEGRQSSRSKLSHNGTNVNCQNAPKKCLQIPRGAESLGVLIYRNSLSGPKWRTK